MRRMRPTTPGTVGTERPLLRLPAAVAVALLGGVALDASFPALGWWPLAFVAVTLALVSLIGRTVWGGVLVGAAFGATFFFPQLSWAAQFLGDNPLGWVPWVALASVETLIFAALTPLVVLAYRPIAGSAA